MIRELSDAGRSFSRLLAAQLFSTRLWRSPRVSVLMYWYWCTVLLSCCTIYSCTTVLLYCCCTILLLYYCTAILLYYYITEHFGVCTLVWPPVQKATNKKREWNQSRDFNGLRCKRKGGVLLAPICTKCSYFFFETPVVRKLLFISSPS